MKKTVIIVTLILSLSSCMLACDNNRISIASYNVDNLFDDIDNGTEYSEFDPGTGKWTHKLFQQKLAATLNAIRSIKNKPDILCLQEIENSNVLNTLKLELGYPWSTAPPDSNSAVTVGILSQFPIIRVAAHALRDVDGNPVRDILEAEMIIRSTTVIVFNCHWKSKSGGAQATEPDRLHAAGVLKARIATLLQKNKNLRIIIAGDLNERHDEYELISQAYRTVLLPPDIVPPNSIIANSMIQSDDITSCSKTKNADIVFQPWYNINSGPTGSYVYSKKWETIDHILLAGDFTEESDISFQHFFVHSVPELVWKETGFPRAWKQNNPDIGASDHLPVVMELHTGKQPN